MLYSLTLTLFLQVKQYSVLSFFTHAIDTAAQKLKDSTYAVTSYSIQNCNTYTKTQSSRCYRVTFHFTHFTGAVPYPRSPGLDSRP